MHRTVYMNITRIINESTIQLFFAINSSIPIQHDKIVKRRCFIQLKASNYKTFKTLSLRKLLPRLQSSTSSQPEVIQFNCNRCDMVFQSIAQLMYHLKEYWDNARKLVSSLYIIKSDKDCAYISDCVICIYSIVSKCARRRRYAILAQELLSTLEPQPSHHQRQPVFQSAQQVYHLRVVSAPTWLILLSMLVRQQHRHQCR